MLPWSWINASQPYLSTDLESVANFKVNSLCSRWASDVKLSRNDCLTVFCNYTAFEWRDLMNCYISILALVMGFCAFKSQETLVASHCFSICLSMQISKYLNNATHTGNKNCSTWFSDFSTRAYISATRVYQATRSTNTYSTLVKASALLCFYLRADNLSSVAILHRTAILRADTCIQHFLTPSALLDTHSTSSNS